MIVLRRLGRVSRPFVDLVRWGEPWDVEDEPDPLLDRHHARQAHRAGDGPW